MCEAYPAIQKGEGGIGRLLEGQCPDCPEAPPLVLHTHTATMTFPNWHPTEWRFGLCKRCEKCWRCELSSEDGTGVIYEIAPRCHQSFVYRESKSIGV